MTEVLASSDLYVGRGVDSTTGRGLAVAIDFDEPQVVSGGQTAALKLMSISSSEELSTHLDMSASASYKAVTFGASAEFSLATSKDVNSYFTYALIRIVVKNADAVLRNPRLKQEAHDLLVQQGWDAFVALYGSEYVQGFITGGAYYVLLEIQTTSTTQRADINAKLSGYYGQTVKADAKLTEALTAIQKNTQINVSVVESGGAGQVIATDLPGMLKAAENFPAVVVANPVPIRALTAEYKDTVLLPLVPPGDSLARTQQKNTLEDLGRTYLQLRDYKANLGFVLSHLTEFDDFRNLDAAGLKQKRQDYQASLEATGKEMDRVVRLGTNCGADFNQCQTYVSAVTPLSLPKIEGQPLVLKQIEDKLAALEAHLTSDQSGSLELGGTSSNPGGGTPYIDFHFGNLAQDYNTRIINDHDGTLSVLVNTLHVKDEVGGSSSQLHVQGDLTVDGKVQMNGKTLDQWLTEVYNTAHAAFCQRLSSEWRALQQQLAEVSKAIDDIDWSDPMIARVEAGRLHGEETALQGQLRQLESKQTANRCPVGG